jgi:RNA polymerase sigma-70 factor, ECF subfamily
MEDINRRDRTLLIAARAGDLASFETLVKLYEKKLFRVVNRIVYDRQSAEEIVQDVFVSVYQTLERIDESRPFSAYLYAVARNASISLLRAKKHEKEVVLEDTHPSVVNIEKDFIDKEERLRIQNALNSLPSKYRLPLRLYYFDDVSYEKIAKTLHIPVNTVRTHLKRAKGLLEELLKL